MTSYCGYTLLVVFTVDLLATAGDLTLSWTSPVYIKLYSNDTSVNPLGKPITENEDAWIGSLVMIGAMIGPFAAGFIAEKFGRKLALLCLAVPHMISLFTMAFATNIYLFYFGRLIAGLSTGGGYTVLPMYIAEISQDSTRGPFTQTLNVFWAFGNFLPYAIGPYLSMMWFNLILACIPTTFFIVFILLGPESPYYLVSVKKMKQAEKALMQLRSLSAEDVQKELDQIKASLKKEEDGRISDILRHKGLRNAFIVCLVLVAAQELSGFCAITFYLETIFEAAHTSIPSDISALIVGAFIFISSFFAPFLIDRLGRRILAITSCFGMVVALGLIGAFFYLEDSTDFNTEKLFWVPIFSLILYIFAFHFGICSVPWTLASELFPSNVKGVSSTLISSTCWITSFFVTKFFDTMNSSMGIAGSFWFFGFCCLATAIFSIFFVPETKGKSFSEIQDMLNYDAGDGKRKGNDIDMEYIEKA